MMNKIINFVLFSTLLCTVTSSSIYEERCKDYKWLLDVKVNHFSFANQRTFKLRYIQNTDSWKAGKPIFFYCGNEADIEDFCNEMGLLWEFALESQAMVVFAEHRYYGQSLPFGVDTFSVMNNLEYLTPEQALTDFAYLIEHIKTTTKGAATSKVIAFGGSYGGILSYLIRVKYPHYIDGAVAASAPLLLNEVDCNAHYNHVTKDFTRYGTQCSEAIRRSWSILNELYQTQTGKNRIGEIFHLCDKNFDLDELKEFLRTSYELVAMSDYPYPTSVFQSLPAWPVKEICSRIMTGLDLNDRYNVLERVYSGLQVYFNYTGDKKCITIGEPDNVPQNEYLAANYQWCTSIFFSFCSNGITDMFEPKEWSFKAYSDKCLKNYGIRPSEEWARVEFGVRNIDAQSRIIFTNGELDPWTASGVVKVNSDELHTIYIKDAAHHLDLWSTNDADPPSVTLARKQIKKIIRQWLAIESSATGKTLPSLLVIISISLFTTSFF